MSWKFFLARLRRFFSLRTRLVRRRRVVKPPPDRRKRVFDFEPFEDRAHMEPPVTSLAAMAVGAGLGVGVYAVNMALVNAQARAESTPAAAPDMPERLSAGSGMAPEVASVDAAAAAIVLGDYSRSSDAPVDTGFSRFEDGRPSAEPLADPVNGEFKPTLGMGGSPLVGPLEAPSFAEAGGGSGAEPGVRSSPGGGSGAELGGRSSPGGGSASVSGGVSAGAGNGLPAGRPGTSGAANPATSPFSFPGGIGLTGPNTPPVPTPPPAGPKGHPGSGPVLGPDGGGGNGNGQAISPSVQQNIAGLSISFEANQGQTDASVEFLTRGGGYVGFLRAGGPTFELARNGPANDDGTRTLDVVSFQYQGADTSAIVTGQNQLPGFSNYFIGGTSTVNVPSFGSVVYQNFYPNIDLVYHAGTADPTKLEYDYVVNPGGDPNAIQFTVLGAQSVSTDAQGNLLITTPGGVLTDAVPRFSQTVNGVAQAVTGSYVVTNGDVVSLQVTGFSTAQPLTIDPTLYFSTYLGGTGNDVGNGITVDNAGNIDVVGNTTSSDFPGTTAGTYKGNRDAFVVKFNGNASALIYSTYLGGSLVDSASSVAADAGGNAYVTGMTTSFNFPTTAGAFQTSKVGTSADAAFVTKLNPSGNALVYSTYLGATGVMGGPADGFGIAVDSSGDAFVTGNAGSLFPTTTGAFQTTLQGNQDAYVTEMSANGRGLIYSTYLGAGGGLGIALDLSGNAYVTGETTSASYPITTGAYQTTLKGSQDAFVTVVKSGGASLVYSTFLDGTGSAQGNAIAVDGAGSAYVTGYTTSTNFPTANAYQASLSGGTGQDAFVTKFTIDGSGLLYSTYLGGTDTDTGTGIAVGGNGQVAVVGYTSSTNFPTFYPAQATNTGGKDAFVTGLTGDGSALTFSSYLGGTLDDQAAAVDFDLQGHIDVTGSTASTNFPTAAPFQATKSGVGTTDAFVSQLVPLVPIIQPEPTLPNNFGSPLDSGAAGGAVYLGCPYT